MPEMIINDANDGVHESLLQVLDEDPSSVTPEQLYTTCEIISQGLDRQVQKIEDDFADIADKQDPQADIGTTASPHDNSKSPEALPDVLILTEPQDAKEFEYIEVRNLDQTDNAQDLQVDVGGDVKCCVCRQQI